jgi:hypothetical protein
MNPMAARGKRDLFAHRRRSDASEPALVGGKREGCGEDEGGAEAEGETQEDDTGG